MLRRPETWAFFLVWLNASLVWHSRDWNTASRLMLTYAIVERGTVRIDGLERQTGDRAFFRGHNYSDKLPGYPLLAAGVYAGLKPALRLPDHPLGQPGFAYWPADWLLTLATSGLLTAATAALLAALARSLGCTPRQSLLVGLAYGLATPAHVYASLAYGHQASAFCLFAAYALLRSTSDVRLTYAIGGFLASYASVIELQVGPVSAILGFEVLWRTLTRQVRPTALPAFSLGAALPALVLLAYNDIAFGSPWELGYFHHATKPFNETHSARNPLGLVTPDLSRVLALLWGGHRGLLFYAPILLLAPIGWAVLARRRQWSDLRVTLAACLAVFLVNLSYPQWTGGWSTGPRLLLPLLPFALVPVAAVLAAGGRMVTIAGVVLTLAGAVLMTLFQGIGGRVPQDVGDPLLDIVWPLWKGDPVPAWWIGERFARNAFGLIFPGPNNRLWVAVLPAVAVGVLAILGMAAVRPQIKSESPAPGPGVRS